MLIVASSGEAVVDPLRDPNRDPRDRLNSDVRGRFRLNKLLFFSVVVAAVVVVTAVVELTVDSVKDVDCECLVTSLLDDSSLADDASLVSPLAAEVKRVLACVTELLAVSLVPSLLVVTSTAVSFNLRLRFLKSGRVAPREFNDRPVDGRGLRMDGLAVVVLVVVDVVVGRRVVVLLERLLLANRELLVGPNRLVVALAAVVTAAVAVTGEDVLPSIALADVELSLSPSFSVVRERAKLFRSGATGRLLTRDLEGAVARALVVRTVAGVVVVVVVLVVARGAIVDRARFSIFSRSREENLFLLREPNRDVLVSADSVVTVFDGDSVVAVVVTLALVVTLAVVSAAAVIVVAIVVSSVAGEALVVVVVVAAVVANVIVDGEFVVTVASVAEVFGTGVSVEKSVLVNTSNGLTVRVEEETGYEEREGDDVTRGAI